MSKALEEMEKTLTNLEKIFLKDKPYLCGNEISIADLSGVCEVSSYELYPSLKMDKASCLHRHANILTGSFFYPLGLKK